MLRTSQSPDFYEEKSIDFSIYSSWGYKEKKESSSGIDQIVYFTRSVITDRDVSEGFRTIFQRYEQSHYLTPYYLDLVISCKGKAQDNCLITKMDFNAMDMGPLVIALAKSLDYKNNIYFFK